MRERRNHRDLRDMTEADDGVADAGDGCHGTRTSMARTRPTMG
jgi:hypothetical protein